MPSAHIIIKGKVQGVFFRATAKDVADRLAITGWIQNTPGGDVEVVATGSEEQLKEFMDWCRKGPLKAEVWQVISNYIDEKTFAGFSIRRR